MHIPYVLADLPTSYFSIQQFTCNNFPPFSTPGSIIIPAVIRPSLPPPLPLSFSCCFSPLPLSGNGSKWVSLKGGWQAAFGTGLTKNPFIKEALVSTPWPRANQIISLSVSEENLTLVCKSSRVCRQADCAPRPTCLSH